MVAVESGTGANLSLGFSERLPPREGAAVFPGLECFPLGRWAEGFAPVPDRRPALPLRAPPRRPWSGLCFMRTQRYVASNSPKAPPTHPDRAPAWGDLGTVQYPCDVHDSSRLARPVHVDQMDIKPNQMEPRSVYPGKGVSCSQEPSLLLLGRKPNVHGCCRIAPGSAFHFMDHQGFPLLCQHVELGVVPNPIPRQHEVSLSDQLSHDVRFSALTNPGAAFQNHTQTWWTERLNAPPMDGCRRAIDGCWLAANFGLSEAPNRWCQ